MIQLFKKDYCAEELADIERDVSECFDETFNPVAGNIPVDEHGFQKGKFTVTIRWEDE